MSFRNSLYGQPPSHEYFLNEMFFYATSARPTFPSNQMLLQIPSLKIRLFDSPSSIDDVVP